MHSMPEPVANLLRPIARSEYERIVGAGVFGDDRVELLYGAIIRMPPHGPPHDATIDRLGEILIKAAPQTAKVRVQSAFAAGELSEPEPDIAMVPRRDYDHEHPNTAFLIVEVAATSLALDRGAKADLCASCEAPEYWVVDVVGRVVEVHTEPFDGRYARVTPYRRGEEISIGAFPDLRIAVDAFLR